LFLFDKFASVYQCIYLFWCVNSLLNYNYFHLCGASILLVVKMYGTTLG